MESFDVDQAVENPQSVVQAASRLRKKDWLALAERYELTISSSARKDEVRERVLRSWREKGLILCESEGGPSAGAGGRPPASPAQSQVSDASWQEFELRKLELQHQEREREKERRKREKERESERKREKKREKERREREK